MLKGTEWGREGVARRLASLTLDSVAKVRAVLDAIRRTPSAIWPISPTSWGSSGWSRSPSGQASLRRQILIHKRHKRRKKHHASLIGRLPPAVGGAVGTGLAALGGEKAPEGSRPSREAASLDEPGVKRRVSGANPRKAVNSIAVNVPLPAFCQWTSDNSGQWKRPMLLYLTRRRSLRRRLDRRR